ncbi:MAG: hypothetical protein Kow006_11940 [Gammaproteobacteria bacterium]
MKRTFACLTGILIALGLGPSHAVAPQVVTLTQTACQFIESEGNVERGFTARSAEECVAINRQTAEKRLAEAAPLRLKAGKTVFRVANRDVPYELGFWLRPARLVDRLTLPDTSGGGLKTGQSRDYVVDLKPGEYLYSCPLNPTPDYRLIVE